MPVYRHRLFERYGLCKYNIKSNGILIHAVSIGEIAASVSLVQKLRYHYPFLPITITTMTPTGSERITTIFKGENINHVYLPYDLPLVMRYFFKIISPKLVIVMETELWPNMISILHHSQIPLVVANARLSDRSKKRYKKIHKFICHLFKKITLIAVQSEEDATRFISLGVPKSQLSVIGNLKFDVPIKSKHFFYTTALRRQWAKNRSVWIAASTHIGEESIILQAHQKLLKVFPDLLLILVPRHLERVKNIQTMVRKLSLKFILRSSGKTPSNNIQVVIGDTIGELVLLYGIADLAFVGGSLVKKGGHNPLEPAIYAIPILMGRYTFNFESICNKLRAVNGLITVFSIESLIIEISNLLIHKNYGLQYGYQAKKVFYENKGAVLRLLELLQPYLSCQKK